MESVKIISLEIENVKRVRAVSLAPAASGLTVIGGNNRQGKSSVLDGIMSALGGEKYTPQNAVHDGAKKGEVTVQLSNGLTVTRSFTGKGSYLKVSGPEGSGGQGLLNEFINAFALDIPSFMRATEKARAKMLMELVGLDLTPLTERRKKLYDDRESIGRLATRAKQHAAAMPYDEQAGLEVLTPTDIMQELQDKLGQNAKNAELRANVNRVRDVLDAAEAQQKAKRRRVQELENDLAAARLEADEHTKSLVESRRNLTTAESKSENLQDADTTSINTKLAEIDEANARVRKNLEREKAQGEADGYQEEYRALTSQIADVDTEKSGLLSAAAMPLPGLSVDDDVLTYDDNAWESLAHSEQLKVATAICRAIKPSQGFVLLDKLEAMDIETLTEFGAWLQTEGIQAIATRVSRGDECSIIIEDGLVVGAEQISDKPTPTKQNDEPEF